MPLSSTAVDMQLQFEVEQFLYNESATLDERRTRDWLDFLTDDIHYWMPIRRTRTVDQLDKEFTAPDEMAFFDDDKTMLEMRVKKLETGYSWSEDPPSRTRHMVTNVRIMEVNEPDVTVESSLLLYRTRLTTEVDMWVALRRDVLRKVEGEWKLANRKVFLDCTTLTSKNLSNLF